MTKLNRDAINLITSNVRQPLEHLYTKLEAEKVFTKTGANEVYDSIYKFLNDLEGYVTDDFGNTSRGINVMIDGDEYRKVEK